MDFLSIEKQACAHSPLCPQCLWVPGGFQDLSCSEALRLLPPPRAPSLELFSPLAPSQPWASS